MAKLFRMVGRDQEFTTLSQAWREACQGKPRLVLISGEPGSGKTRLVQELYRRITMAPDAETAEDSALHGQTGTGLPDMPLAMDDGAYWPDLLHQGDTWDRLIPPLPEEPEDVDLDFKGWFNQLLQNKQHKTMPFYWLAWKCTHNNQYSDGSMGPVYTGMPQINQHLAGALFTKLKNTADTTLFKSLGSILAGRMPIVGDLTDVIDVGRAFFENRRAIRQAMKEQQASQERDQTAMRREFRNMIVRYFRMLGTPGDQHLPTVPAILAVDDMQWVDKQTYSLVCELIQTAQDEHWPFLIATTVRSNEMHKAVWTIEDLEGTVTRNGDDYSFNPVSLSAEITGSDDVAVVVREHLPQASETTVGQVAKRAGGQPYYIVNYARLVGEEHGWLDENGDLTETGRQGILNVPKKIKAVIDRRLAALDELPRSILHWGSVQGMKFFDEFIHRVGQELNFTKLKLNGELEGLCNKHNLTGEGYKLNQVLNCCPFGHHLVFEQVLKQFQPGHRQYQNVKDILRNLLFEYLAGDRIDDWSREDQLEAMELLARIAYEDSETKAEFAARLRLNHLLRTQWRVTDAIVHADRASVLLQANPEYIEDVPFWDRIEFMHELMDYNHPGAVPLAKSLMTCPAPKTGSSESVMRNYMVLVGTCGSILEQSGDRKQARTLFELALITSRRIVADFGDAPQSLRDISVSLDRLGDVLWAEGERQEARDHFQESLAIRRRIVADFGESPESLRDISVSLDRLGDVLWAEGERQEARDHFQESLAILRRIVADFGESPESLRDISVSLDRLGDVLWAEGERQEARDHFQESLAIRRRIVADFGDAPQSLRDISVSLNKLGDVLWAEGERQEARDHFQESLAISRRIVADFGDAPQSLRDISVSLNKLGDVLWAEGERQEARDHFQESLAIRRRIVADFGDAPQSLRDISVSLDRLGDVLWAEG